MASKEATSEISFILPNYKLKSNIYEELYPTFDLTNQQPIYLFPKKGSVDIESSANESSANECLTQIKLQQNVNHVQNEAKLKNGKYSDEVSLPVIKITDGNAGNADCSNINGKIPELPNGIPEMILKLEKGMNLTEIPAGLRTPVPKTRRKKKKKKNISFGCLMNDGVRRVDFVLIYEKKSDQPKNQQMRDYFQENLIQEGLQLEIEEVEDFGKHLTFVKIHAPWKVLCRMAEKLKFYMPMWIHDAPLVQKHSKLTTFWRTLWDCGWCRKAPDKNRQRLMSDKVHITSSFSEHNMDRYAVKSKDSFFSNKERIEIVWGLLENIRTDKDDDKKRGIERLLGKGVYETAYPLHEGRYECTSTDDNMVHTTRQKLTLHWATWSAFYKPQPLERIRQYLGEKIAFYFAFMDFYTKMLIFPTLMGIAVFVAGLCYTDNGEAELFCDHHHAPGNYHYCPVCRPPDCAPWMLAEEACSKYRWSFRLDNLATMTLSYCVMFWAIIFLKLWKRRESTLAAEWDTLHVEEEDYTIRPDFSKKAPESRKNPVTLSVEPHMPFHLRVVRLAFSILVTLFILCLVGCCLLILLVCRIALYGTFRRIGGILAEASVEYARWAIHGLLFLMIQFYERIYHYVAHKLTDLECPRTNNKFINSLLWKLFIFEMLNEFVPIIYPAFLKGKTVATPLDLGLINELCDGSCTSEVTELVSILLLLRMGVQNIIEISVPLLRNRLARYRAHNLQEHSDQPQWLRDFHLIPVDLDGVYEDYMEMMIQFGFVMLFIPAFPLAALVCLINNIFDIRIDSIKILRTRRRPVPIRVASISTWNRFLEIIVKLSIISNAAYLAFTCDIASRIFYIYFISDGSLEGYAIFSLTSINVVDWGDHGLSMLKHNITKCYYAEYRYDEPPYGLTPDFWKVMVLRLVIFATYIILFYGIMWVVNICVDDMPEDVSVAAKRQKHIVQETLEAEGVLRRGHWHKNAEENSPDLGPFQRLNVPNNFRNSFSSNSSRSSFISSVSINMDSN